MQEPGKATILVVDDEEGICRSLAGVLRDEGYEAVTAPGEASALEQLDASDPSLVLLDVLLGPADGLELLARIHQRRPGLPVVMMSGHGTIEIAVRATRLGAYDFLEKPLHPPKLLLTVRRALEHTSVQRENEDLRRTLAGDELLGESPAMQELRQTIARAAPSNGRVLIMGESGTGKELVARAVHQSSLRREAPFVKMNCAAIPKDLVESELFGHEKGAFTGALRLHRGRFELAHRGTLFLDEVGDMSLEAQAKLLRVLEEGEIERVGGTRPIPVSVRVLAASNKDLAAEIAAGCFREDLFFRLAVIQIRAPALRDHREDVPALAQAFLARYAEEYGRPVRQVTAEGMRLLAEHPWPGNVRELRNVVERLAIMGQRQVVEAGEVRAALVQGPRPAGRAEATGALGGGDTADGPIRERLDRFEEALIRQVLEETAWRVSEAARRLQTDRANLHRRMRRLGIERG